MAFDAIFQDFLTINDVAKAKHVNRRTVTEWIQRGLISAHKFGTAVLIEKGSLTGVPLHHKIHHRKKRNKRA